MDALWKLNLENTRKSEESLKANPRATLAAKGLTNNSFTARRHTGLVRSIVYQEYCHGTFFEQVGHLLSRDRFFELVEEYRDEKRRIEILKFKRSFCLKNV